METKTMCTKTDLLSDKRFAHSASPTLAGIPASVQGISVSIASMGSVEYVRERVGSNNPFFATDVAASACREVTALI